jgi:hypothetical protein
VRAHRHPFLILWLSVVVIGCECRRSGANSISGEVRWEWETPLGTESDSSARVDFPPTSMGGRRDQVLYVRNVGRAPFTMSDFGQLAGAPTSLNLMPVPNSAFEVRWDPTVVLNPTERTQLTVSFTPPITDGNIIDYESALQLKPSGANPSPLTLSGRAIAGQCDAPQTIDFGSVPLRSTLTSDLDVRNDGLAPVLVTAGGVTGAPVGIFDVTGIMNGRLEVQPGTAPKLTIAFTPSEPGDFTGEFLVRRSESCPQRKVTLKGRGVNSCLTWKAEPTDDAQGLGAHFGAVAPGTIKPGKVTWSNACSIPAELSDGLTTEPVFALTSPALFTVPAATRDASGAWLDGSAVTTLEFRPVVLGTKQGTLRVTTNFSAQPQLGVSLKGFGGGPRIQVTPSPIFAVGRIGFTPGAMPGTSVQRTLKVSNVGSRPNPPDPRANLMLGVDGMGATYFEVRAINGTAQEICVGQWDSMNDRCTDTVVPPLYDPAQGIEAIAGGGLNLPIRIVPTTAGLKEWEITIYSNDVATPEARVRVTAEAMAAPPCNYTVAPTTLSYGLMNFPQTTDLSFTLTNLGTTATEVCYFNGIRLSATTDPTFTLPNNPIDLTLAPGASTAVTVRGQPLMPPAATRRVTGEVQFNVSTPAAPQAAVLLDATLAPSCLTIQPSPVDFVDTELECGSPERAVTVSNTCSMSVTLNTATLTNAAPAPAGTGSCTTAGGCPQFAISAGLPMGVLAPGQSRTMLLRFRPYLTGMHTGELTITAQQGAMAIPYTTQLRGTGRARTSATCGVAVSCPPPMTVNANSTVTLSPTIMAPGAVSCMWGIQSRPSTSNGNFSNAASCTSTTYFADVVGTHLVTFNVNDGLGSTAQCTTPITVTANGDLWIELTWDRNNDMDLHLLHPNAGAPGLAASWFNTVWDCNFITDLPSWSANAQNNPSLDRDDITGRGPENIRINTPQPNLNYAVGVHVYSYVASPNPVLSTLKVYCGGQLMTTQTRSMSRNKDMWVVGTINFGSTNPCLFTPTNSVINVP